MAPAPRHVRGIGLILLMRACFALLDNSAKYLGQFMPALAEAASVAD